MERKLELEIQAQPNDSTCGPTCLHAVYRYYGDTLPLEQVIRETPMIETGGTLAVQLGVHALRRGYAAEINTLNLAVFDPSWFKTGVDLPAKLRAQAAIKKDPRLQGATEVYLEFLELGGVMRMEQLGSALLRKHLADGHPILTGLSATFLYACPREAGETVLQYDDVGGQPTGHFVVLCGYDRKSDEVLIADPLRDNPGYGSQYYREKVERVFNAICLGVITFDANTLVISRPVKARETP